MSDDEFGAAYARFQAAWRDVERIQQGGRLRRLAGLVARWWRRRAGRR